MLQSSNEQHARKKLGSAGEQTTVSYLEKHNFIILSQNYTKRYGEIDVIARKKDLVVFVEVKLRKNNYFHLSEVITLQKQKKIIRTAKAFILEHKLYNVIYRFDVALIIDKNSNQEITYIESAFTDATE